MENPGRWSWQSAWRLIYAVLYTVCLPFVLTYRVINYLCYFFDGMFDGMLDDSANGTRRGSGRETIAFRAGRKLDSLLQPQLEQTNPVGYMMLGMAILLGYYAWARLASGLPLF